jgi:hypothetical protein
MPLNEVGMEGLDNWLAIMVELESSFAIVLCLVT